MFYPDDVCKNDPADIAHEVRAIVETELLFELCREPTEAEILARLERWADEQRANDP